MAAPGGYQRLGDWLLDRGLITEEELSIALRRSREEGKRLGEVMAELGYADSSALISALAEQYSLEVEDLSEVKPSKDALELLPAGFALAHLALPLACGTSWISICISDPLDVSLTDEITKRLHRRVELSLAPPQDLYQAIVKWYRLPFKTKRARGRVQSVDAQVDRRELLDALTEAQNQAGAWGGREAA